MTFGHCPATAREYGQARNDVAGTGMSSLTVRGDIEVQNGATLAMGCEPNFNPCLDDANATGQNNNSPATQYGDSMSSPNRVRGQAFGECSFNVRKPNPAPSGPLAPISVKV